MFRPPAAKTTPMAAPTPVILSPPALPPRDPAKVILNSRFINGTEIYNKKNSCEFTFFQLEYPSEGSIFWTKTISENVISPLPTSRYLLVSPILHFIPFLSSSFFFSSDYSDVSPFFFLFPFLLPRMSLAEVEFKDKCSSTAWSVIEPCLVKAGYELCLRTGFFREIFLFLRHSVSITAQSVID